MDLFVVGLNHKTAPVELREQLAVNSSDLVSRAREVKLREDLDEIVLLSTCNRVEIYATFPHRVRYANSLLQSLCAEPRDFQPHTYLYENFDAARHLLRRPIVGDIDPLHPTFPADAAKMEILGRRRGSHQPPSMPIA